MDIIQSFDQKSLLMLMKEFGLPSAPSHFRDTFYGVRRKVSSLSRYNLRYDIFLEDETVKLVGEISDADASMEYVIDWNNNSSISPLLISNDDLILVFNVNVRRSIPFGTLKHIVHTFEKELMRLDVEFIGMDTEDLDMFRI